MHSPPLPLSTAKPRLLLITPRFPYPPIGGDRLRIYHLACALAKSFDITLASLCDSDQVPELPAGDANPFQTIHRIQLPKWRSWLNAALALPGAEPLQVAYYRSRAFAQLIDRLAPEHDIVMAHLIRTAPYALRTRLPKVLEMTDAISMSMARAKAQPGKGLTWRAALYRYEAIRAARYELDLLGRFNVVSVVSEVDKHHLLRHAQRALEARVLVVPNGVPPAVQVAVGPSKDIVFIGNMATLPNRDALDYFLADVLPRVRNEEPHARLRVVGPVNSSQARALRRHPGVDVLGMVSDLSAALNHAAVGVCPVLIGAGMQNKLLDYLAHGLPAITSPIGLEGLDALPETHVLLARNTDEWVKHTVACLALSESVIAMGERGRELARQRYGWARHAQGLVQASESALTRSFEE